MWWLALKSPIINSVKGASIFRVLFDLIQDGFFRGCSRMGDPSRKFVTHILQWWKLAQLYLTKSRSKRFFESRGTPFDFCWNQHFFTRNQQILLYQEIQIQIAIWYIISYSFNFSWVFKDCLNKHGYNFDDVGKNDYPRPS